MWVHLPQWTTRGGGRASTCNVFLINVAQSAKKNRVDSIIEWISTCARMLQRATPNNELKLFQYIWKSTHSNTIYATKTAKRQLWQKWLKKGNKTTFWSFQTISIGDIAIELIFASFVAYFQDAYLKIIHLARLLFPLRRQQCKWFDRNKELLLLGFDHNNDAFVRNESIWCWRLIYLSTAKNCFFYLHTICSIWIQCRDGNGAVPKI